MRKLFAKLKNPRFLALSLTLGGGLLPFADHAQVDADVASSTSGIVSTMITNIRGVFTDNISAIVVAMLVITLTLGVISLVKRKVRF